MIGLKRFGAFLTFAAILFMLAGTVSAQEMTYEEYKVQLGEYEKRTADAKRALLECNQATDDLAKQLSKLKGEFASVQQEIYGLVESDEAGVNAYLKELDQMEARLMGLLSLSDDDLFGQRDEVDAMEARLKELKASKIAALPAAQKKLKSIDQLMGRVKDRMPRKRIKKYTVAKGDYLWKIAKKPDIYNDPYLWPRIYVENRTMIKNPDLIYPDWVLNVPFGVDLNRHLVTRGDNLSKLAGTLYKDAAKWHRIYQANKTQILDPNLIFPAQVFDIPAN